MTKIKPDRSGIKWHWRILGATIGALILGAVLRIWLARADDVVPLPPVIEADGSMGTCYSFYEIDAGQEPLAREAYAAGSRWDRFDVRWNAIESEPGQFDFAPHEQLVDRDLDYGLQIVAILGSTAQWAATDCASTAQVSQPDPLPLGHPPLPQSTDDSLWWRACPPKNLDRPWNDPTNYWGRYVYETAHHFRDKIDVWEIWNEPDLLSFWTGSPAEYARLLQVGYRAVKAADPEATVLFGGLAYWTDPSFYKQVLHELQMMDGASEHNGYFDALSLHLYSNVYNIAPVASQIQADMLATVGPHPIWLTETGVPIWGENQQPDPYDYSATAEEGAAFMIQGYAAARSAGIERFFVFRTHDHTMGEAFGLIRNDRSLRPGYVAYQVAARYLHGENQITGPFSDGTVRRITFWGTSQGRIDVLWKETGGEAIQHRHPAVVPTATLVDHHGQHQVLNADQGAFSMSLDPATANTGYYGEMIIGGPPVLLIQSDPEIPTSTLRPLPSTATTTALTLTWDVTDTVSGYWYAQIDEAPTPNGPWSRAADWSETRGSTQTVVDIPVGEPAYFRARVRDNVGNWEPWPATAEVSTTAYLTRTVHLSLTSYLDENGNDTWDSNEPVPLSPPSISWRSLDGTVITETHGTSWSVTETVQIGTYVLETRLPQYLRDRTPLLVAEQPVTQTISVTVGLKPIRGQSFLPIVVRGASP